MKNRQKSERQEQNKTENRKKTLWQLSRLRDFSYGSL
jgi:hypothetical protein